MYKYYTEIWNYLRNDTNNNLLTGCDQKIRREIFECIETEFIYFYIEVGDDLSNQKAKLAMDETRLFPLFDDVYNVVKQFLPAGKIFLTLRAL